MMTDIKDIFYENRLPEREAFFELFQTTGWYPEYNLDADRLYDAISNSWYVVSAHDNGRLVGFGRIVSDGIVHALIVDVIVLPAYQRKGLGGTIMRLLTDHCRSKRVCDIQLFCAKGKIDFYRSLGFELRPEDAPGMQYVAGKMEEDMLPQP